MYARNKDGVQWAKSSAKVLKIVKKRSSQQRPKARTRCIGVLDRNMIHSREQRDGATVRPRCTSIVEHGRSVYESASAAPYEEREQE